MTKEVSIVLLFLTVLVGSFGACSSGKSSEDPFPIATETGSDPSPISATVTPIISSKPVDLASIYLPDALASGKPTLAEFGRGTCIPCKQMKPILEELAAEYGETINVVIVEIQNHMDLTRSYKIVAIPTQIFFDATGKEIDRHIGFYARDKIVAKFGELGFLKK